MLINLTNRNVLRDASKGGGSGGDDQSPEWKGFYDGLDDAQKALIDKRLHNLTTALQSERDGSKTLSKQLSDMKAKAEKGSELEKTIGEMQSKLAAANERTAFIEEAVKRGVANPGAAYHTAKGLDLIDDRGVANFDKLKEEVPGLFVSANGKTGGEGKKSTGGGAGTGSGDQGSARDSKTISTEMNQAIRSMAGRGQNSEN